VFTFSCRTTSLRVSDRAARRSCLPGLRCGGGGRQAGAAVLSCLVWRCEMTAGQVRSASECVRRTLRRRTHSDTDQTQNAPLCCWDDSVHTATTDTTKQSCLCRVLPGVAAGSNFRDPWPTMPLNREREREFIFHIATTLEEAHNRNTKLGGLPERHLAHQSWPPNRLNYATLRYILYPKQ